ncbi:restriction endonuclease subunit S [Apilactobacillus kunkeei]|uniref:restriction endonuclease subunit S n=1 Tax=Apilactobacillus kunkeei TaxID=148814 RepID=UPI0030EAFD25
MAYKNVPRLRFREFSGEWKYERLSKNISLLNGLTYSPKDVNSVGTFVIRSSNVKDNSLIDNDNVYVNSQVVNSEHVKQGDIVVVVRNGSRALIGKHAIVNKNMSNTVIGAFMTLIRTKNGRFYNALLSTDLFKKEIYKSLGATINQITKKDFGLMDFFFPNSDEQQKIGSFFAKQDKLIELQTQKVDQLKKLKRGYLQKMFPQEGETVPRLRFSGFSWDWKEVTLNDIGKIVTGNTPTKKDKNNYGGSYVWITPSDINEESTYLYDSKTKLTKKGKELSRVIPKNSLMVTCIASIGKNALSGKEVSINQQINAVIPYDIYNSYFLLGLSSEWSNKMKKKTSNSSLKIINRSEFSRLKTLVPSLDEQKIIGDFFAKLDKLIEEQSNKLDQLKQQKKAYLQKMFV